MTIGDLKLLEVKNPLSMSVLYDLLWIWQKDFRVENSDNARAVGSWQPLKDEYLPSYIPIEEVNRIITEPSLKIV